VERLALAGAVPGLAAVLFKNSTQPRITHVLYCSVLYLQPLFTVCCEYRVKRCPA
jgi:hypothetical protein